MAMKLNYDVNNEQANTTKKMTVKEAVNYIQDLTGMNREQFGRAIGQKTTQYKEPCNSDLFGCALAFGWDVKMVNGAGEELDIDSESLLLGVAKGAQRIDLIKTAREDYILDTEIQVEELRKKLKAAEALLNNLKR